MMFNYAVEDLSGTSDRSSVLPVHLASGLYAAQASFDGGHTWSIIEGTRNRSMS